MFRILTLTSIACFLTIGHAAADDAEKCPNAAELIKRSGVSNIELAQAIQCVAKGLDKQSTDTTKSGANAILQLAGKIIGNGSPVASKIIGSGSPVASKIIGSGAPIAAVSKSVSAPIAEAATDNP